MAGSIGAHETQTHQKHKGGIVAPPVSDDFEIRRGVITMVQDNIFLGKPEDDPIAHLDKFERICSLTKIQGITEDGFRLRLFPFSLGEKAAHWETNLQPGSITS